MKSKSLSLIFGLLVLAASVVNLVLDSNKPRALFRICIFIFLFFIVSRLDRENLKSLVRLISIAVLGLIFSQLAVLGLMSGYGYTFAELSAMGSDFMTKASAGFIRSSLMLGHIFTFIIPSFVFAFLFLKSEKWKELQLYKKPLLTNLGLAVVFLVVSYPAVSYSYVINNMIPLADWMISKETETAAILDKVLTMDSFGIFMINIFIVAVIPAIGEELMFRGLLQRIFEKGSKNGHFAVIVSALIFSLFHMQFQGFLPRFMLGLILGYAFLWTRNLWVPILLHFFNNALPIVGLYFFDSDLAATDPSAGPEIKWYLGLASLCLGLIIGFYFLKSAKEHERT